MIYESVNLYGVLGVPSNALYTDISDAYFRLVNGNNPYTSTTANPMVLEEASIAFMILGDSQLRRIYDLGDYSKLPDFTDIESAAWVDFFAVFTKSSAGIPSYSYSPTEATTRFDIDDVLQLNVPGVLPSDTDIDSIEGMLSGDMSDQLRSYVQINIEVIATKFANVGEWERILFLSALNLSDESKDRLADLALKGFSENEQYVQMVQVAPIDCIPEESRKMMVREAVRGFLRSGDLSSVKSLLQYPDTPDSMRIEMCDAILHAITSRTVSPPYHDDHAYATPLPNDCRTGRDMKIELGKFIVDICVECGSTELLSRIIHSNLQGEIRKYAKQKMGSAIEVSGSFSDAQEALVDFLTCPPDPVLYAERYDRVISKANELFEIATDSDAPKETRKKAGQMALDIYAKTGNYELVLIALDKKHKCLRATRRAAKQALITATEVAIEMAQTTEKLEDLLAIASHESLPTHCRQEAGLCAIYGYRLPDTTEVDGYADLGNFQMVLEMKDANGKGIGHPPRKLPRNIRREARLAIGRAVARAISDSEDDGPMMEHIFLTAGIPMTQRVEAGEKAIDAYSILPDDESLDALMRIATSDQKIYRPGLRRVVALAAARAISKFGDDGQTLEMISLNEDVPMSQRIEARRKAVEAYDTVDHIDALDRIAKSKPKWYQFERLGMRKIRKDAARRVRRILS